MQLRRGPRAIALLLTGCVLFAGLAALRHEATVAHAHGALTGAAEHTHALAELHELSTTPHLHGRNVEAHADGACTLLAALDHSTILTRATCHDAAPRPIIQVAQLAVTLTPLAHALYRLAPKTSPPAIV